eukprot:Nk52_evm8s219 gene=Nk52_evmTU8s219
MKRKWKRSRRRERLRSSTGWPAMRLLLFCVAYLLIIGGGGAGKLGQLMQPVEGAAPVGGGAGKAINFNHAYPSIIGMQWHTGIPDDLFTIEVWLDFHDYYLDNQVFFTYAAFDPSRTPFFDSSNEIVFTYTANYTAYGMGTIMRCEGSVEPRCKQYGEGWVHMAYTADHTKREFKVYKNGEYVWSVPVDSMTDSWKVPRVKKGCMAFGQENDKFCGDFDKLQSFDGNMDEIRIWKTVRTEAEIKANYLTKLDPASEPNLVVYWTFDDGNAAQATDSTSNNFHGGFTAPTLDGVLTYPNDPALNPTPPSYVESGAPLRGGGTLTVRVHVGTGAPASMSVDLLAYDADGDDLTTIITALPTKGTLTQSDNSTAISSVPTTVTDTSVKAGKKVTYTFTASQASPGGTDTMSYTVQDATSAAIAVAVTFQFVQVATPRSITSTQPEDALHVLILGVAGAGGNMQQVVITSLPTKGALYKVAFQANRDPNYNVIEQDVSKLTAISLTGGQYIVEDQRGVVIFVPSQNEFAIGSAYSSFKYKLKDGLTESAEATVELFVTPANDMPVVPTVTLSMTDELAPNAGGAPPEAIKFALSSTDVDVQRNFYTEFRPGPFYKFIESPRYGKLYEVAADGVSLGREIEIQDSVKVLQFASKVMDVSQQFSLCGNICHNITTCPSSCASDAWHASQILGAPDGYPKYGDFKTGWDPPLDRGPEWIELEYENAVYVDSIGIYETFKPGAVVKISVSNTYLPWGQTKWQTFWKGDIQDVPEVARVFSPSGCPHQQLVKYVRFDMECKLKPGWQNYDAAELSGFLVYGRGLVNSTSLTPEVYYVPDLTVYTNSSDKVRETFQYSATDCEGNVFKTSPIIVQDNRKQVDVTQAPPSWTPSSPTVAAVGESISFGESVKSVLASKNIPVSVLTSQESSSRTGISTKATNGIRFEFLRKSNPSGSLFQTANGINATDPIVQAGTEITHPELKTVYIPGPGENVVDFVLRINSSYFIVREHVSTPESSSVDLIPIVVPVVAGVVVIALILFCVGWSIKQKRENTLKSMNWLIKSSDVQAQDGDKLHQYSFLFSGENIRESRAMDAHSLATSASEYSSTSIARAVYQNQLVHMDVLKLSKPVVINETLTKIINVRKDFSHSHVCNFIGVCPEPGREFILYEFCHKGSLNYLLHVREYRLEDMFRVSLVHDVIEGLTAIQDNNFGFHGNLSSFSCVIDSRWTLKLTDFGIFQLTADSMSLTNPENASSRLYKLLWKSPEELSYYLGENGEVQGAPTAPTSIYTTTSGWSKTTPEMIAHRSKDDIYSLGILICEIYSGKLPFQDEVESIQETLMLVLKEFKKPEIPDTLDNTITRETVLKCLYVREQRPNIHFIRKQLSTKANGGHSNIIDRMSHMLIKYSSDLEQLVQKRTEQLEEKHQKLESLLTQVMPKSVYKQIQDNGSYIPEFYESATIYFNDIVAFTTKASTMSPMEVVLFLNWLFVVFDDIAENFNVYKVETIGDSYMISSGVPIRNGTTHAREICQFALAIREEVTKTKDTVNEFEIRSGIHSGSCVAGVIGLKMPRYCLFGDTINTASRMESTSEAMRIQITEETIKVLDKTKEQTLFEIEERGEIEVKGKGTMKTFWLNSMKNGGKKLSRQHHISGSHVMSEDVGFSKRSSVSSMSMGSHKSEPHSINEGSESPRIGAHRLNNSDNPRPSTLSLNRKLSVSSISEAPEEVAS